MDNKETERQRAGSKRLRSASSEEEGREGRELFQHHHHTPATTTRSVIHSSSPGPSSVAPRRRGSAVSRLCPRVSPPPQPSSLMMPLCAPRRALAGGRAAFGHAAFAAAAATVVAIPGGIHSSDRWTALEVSIPRVEVESPTANVVNDSCSSGSSSSGSSITSIASTDRSDGGFLPVPTAAAAIGNSESSRAYGKAQVGFPSSSSSSSASLSSSSLSLQHGGVPAGSRCSGNGPTAAAGVAGGGIGGGGGGLSEEDVPLVEVKATEGGDSIYSLRESAPTRRGKWSRLEEEYAKRVVRDFEEGVLDAPAGAGLRKLLASKLGCDLMRVSKKFSGWACVGRRGFQPVRHPDGRASRAKESMFKMEQRWLKSLASKSSKPTGNVAINDGSSGIAAISVSSTLPPPPSTLSLSSSPSSSSSSSSSSSPSSSNSSSSSSSSCSSSAPPFAERGSSTKSAARSPPLPPVADAGGNMKEEQRDSNTAAPARPWSAARGQHSPTRDSSPGAIHPPEKEVPPSNGGGGGGSRSVGLSPCRGNRETAERDGEEPREEETNGRELSPPQQPQPQPQPLPSSPPWEGNAGRGQPVGRHGNENGHCRWTAPSSVPSSPHDSSCRTGGRAPPRKHEGVYLRRSERSRSPPDISSPSWPSPRERVSRETADGGDMCTVFPGRGGEDRRTAAMVVAAQPATNEGNNNAAGLVARRLSSGGVGGSGVGGGSGGGDSGWPPDPSATAGHEEMDRSREQASRSRQQLRRFSTGCAPFRLKPATLPPHFGMEDHEQQMFLPLGATDNQAVEFMTVGPPPPPQQQRRQERSREGCGYPHRVEEETSPPWWAKTGLPAGTRIHPQHHRSAKAPRMMGCFLRDSTYGSGGDYYSGHDNDNSDYSGHREQQPRRQQWWALSQADSPGRTGRTAVAANSSNHGWQQYAHSGGGAFSGNGGNGGGGGIRAAELEGVHRIGSGPPAACGGTPPTIAYNSHDRSSSLRLSTRPFPETTQWRSNVRANVAPRVRGRGGAAAYQQDWATFGSSVTGRRVECVYRREAEEDEVCGYVCLR